MHQDRVIRLHVPPDLFERIEEKRSGLNVSLQELAIRLFEQWLAGDEGHGPEAHVSNDPLLEKLAAIRASGDERAINALTQAIEAYYGILKHSLKPEEIAYLRAAKRPRSKR